MENWNWISVVKIIGNWTPYSIHERVMSLISLSYVIGDAIARVILGLMIEKYNYNWRDIILLSSLLTFIFVFPVLILLRNDPTKR